MPEGGGGGVAAGEGGGVRVVVVVDLEGEGARCVGVGRVGACHCSGLEWGSRARRIVPMAE